MSVTGVDDIEPHFSYRLPISLAAGVPHVTTWHEGFDQLFADCPGLHLCKPLDEAIHMCRVLLDEGRTAKRRAAAYLKADILDSRSSSRAIALHIGPTA